MGQNTDLSGNELVNGSEAYYEAEDGLNVVLTIDETIQYYVERALEEGMEETDADRIMCLVMDPKTGEILASAVTPGFDPNNATEPDDEEEKKLLNPCRQMNRSHISIKCGEIRSSAIHMSRGQLLS